MHMDNPVGLSNIIINDLLGEQLEVVQQPQDEQEDYQTEFMSQIDSLAGDEAIIPQNNYE